ncbi:OmpW/AlkL family protein [Pararobbsia silviterrae]|uniref:OmpW family protein n=1 Tax=Pararobbsia silviterrae TaxID=1792498 RepID=A0A494X4S6_9BURK|nr:OmpW family outer membrane protein [Pararobbsia silviterrae]RKP45717.1 OmpW family protein [Pararobbsia silviterrae]
MNYKIIAAGAMALACAGAAHAQSAGSFILSTGWFHLSPQDQSSPFTLVSRGGTTFNDPIANTGAAVSDADTIGFTGTYFVTDNIAVEGVMGVPPKFYLSGEGQLAAFGELGQVRQWSPTLLLKYYFGQATQRLRPYLGIGVSRVWFSDAQITNQSFISNVAILNGPTTVSVENKWAAVFNGGFTFQITDHWYAGWSLSYMPLKTTATLYTPQSQSLVGKLNSVSKADIKLNPIISYINVGYKF